MNTKENDNEPLPASVLFGGWVLVSDRLPTRADANNRLGNVLWIECDGFVCEPVVGRWNNLGPSCCTRVAWMPIPSHTKWYPPNDQAQQPPDKKD